MEKKLYQVTYIDFNDVVLEVKILESESLKDLKIFADWHGKYQIKNKSINDTDIRWIATEIIFSGTVDLAKVQD